MKHVMTCWFVHMFDNYVVVSLNHG